MTLWETFGSVEIAPAEKKTAESRTLAEPLKLGASLLPKYLFDMPLAEAVLAARKAYPHKPPLLWQKGRLTPDPDFSRFCSLYSWSLCADCPHGYSRDEIAPCKVWQNAFPAYRLFLPSP